MTKIRKPYEPYSGKIISRESARYIDLKLFFTAESCVRGHISQRSVCDNKCYECRRISWEKTRRKKGRPVFVANSKKAEAARLGDKKYNDGSICVNGHQSERWTHNSACCECVRVHLKKNAHKRVQYLKKWQDENREIIMFHNKKGKAKRRALIASAAGQHNTQDIKRIGNKQKWKCAVCKVHAKNNYHLDHILPLSKGGSNWPSNLQILCPKCNLSKSAKHPVDFMRERGFLL